MIPKPLCWTSSQGINKSGNLRFLSRQTVRHTWLPPRLSAISCYLPRLLCVIKGFLARLSAWNCFLPRLSVGSSVTRTISAGSRITHRVSAGSRIEQTVSEGSHFLRTTVLEGNERSRTVSVEAMTDSLGRKKIGQLVYTLWSYMEHSAVRRKKKTR